MAEITGAPQYEVAVIGAGPAGIAAAVGAAVGLAGRQGAAVARQSGIAVAEGMATAAARVPVLMVDAAPRPGGQIWRHRSRSELPPPAQRWLERLDRSGTEILCGASVVDIVRAGQGAAGGGEARGNAAASGSKRGPAGAGISDLTSFGMGTGGYGVSGSPGYRLSLDHGGVARVVRARQLILATGARELFLPFPGWTLPRVVGVGGAQALLRSGLSLSGRRVVLAGSGPLLLAVAAALARAGARVVIVAEQAKAGAVLRFGAGLWHSPGKALQALRYRAALGGTRIALGCWVTRADGDDAVREVTLTDGRRSWTESCDLLCTGYGLVPNTELARLLGCAVSDGRVEVDEWQRTTVPGVYSAGETTGIAGVDVALVEGEIAGRMAGGSVGSALTAGAGAATPSALDHLPGRAGAATNSLALTRLLAARARERAFAERLAHAFALRGELRSLPDSGTIICRCEDLTFGLLDPGWCARQAKLYTRVGMGSCQARVCGPALAHLFGWDPDTVRVPAFPTPVSTLTMTSESAESAEGDH